MIRTKHDNKVELPVMVRTKKTGSVEVKYPELYQPYGGHMPFPSESCPLQNRIFVGCGAGVTWINNYFCSNNLCKCAPCERRRTYKANNTREWYNEAERLRQVRVSLRGGDDKS